MLCISLKKSSISGIECCWVMHGIEMTPCTVGCLRQNLAWIEHDEIRQVWQEMGHFIACMAQHYCTAMTWRDCVPPWQNLQRFWVFSVRILSNLIFWKEQWNVQTQLMYNISRMYCMTGNPRVCLPKQHVCLRNAAVGHNSITTMSTGRDKRKIRGTGQDQHILMFDISLCGRNLYEHIFQTFYNILRTYHSNIQRTQVDVQNPPYSPHIIQMHVLLKVNC